MPKEIKIGGNTFAVEPLPAMRAFRLQPKIAPAVGEMFAALAPLLKMRGDEAALDKEIDLGVMVATAAPSLSKIALALPSDDLEAITRELLYATAMDGQLLFDGPSNRFDVLMRGRALDVWKLLTFAIQVNYPDFFAALGALSAKPAGAAPSAT